MAAALAHQLLAGAQQIAHLLGLLVRYKTAPDQAVRQKIGQPGGVVHIGLAPGHILDVRRVRQHQDKVAVAEDMPHRLPIDAGRLHCDVGAAVLGQSDRASKSLVVVLKVRTSRSTEPVAMWRTQATTVSLCTSRPAQCGYRTSIVPSSTPPAWDPRRRKSRTRARGCRQPTPQSGVLKDPGSD